MLSLFPFPSLHYHVHMDRQSPFTSPMHSQGATSICHLWTTSMKIPSNPRWSRSCLQMGCSRMGRGKQHLLLDECLCMKGSLLDGFPCTEFFSLPTFDYLTALLKITLERWKEGNSEIPYSVCFSPAGPATLQPGSGRGRGIGARSSHPWQQGVENGRVGDTDTAGARAGRQTLFLSQLSQVIPAYLQNYPLSRHGEE